MSSTATNFKVKILWYSALPSLQRNGDRCESYTSTLTIAKSRALVGVGEAAHRSVCITQAHLYNNSFKCVGRKSCTLPPNTLHPWTAGWKIAFLHQVWRLQLLDRKACVISQYPWQPHGLIKILKSPVNSYNRLCSLSLLSIKLSLPLSIHHIFLSISSTDMAAKSLTSPPHYNSTCSNQVIYSLMYSDCKISYWMRTNILHNFGVKLPQKCVAYYHILNIKSFKKIPTPYPTLGIKS